MSDDDPVYEYVKGQGWVAAPAVDFVLFEFKGKSYRMEARKPRTGESGTYIRPTSKDYVKDGKPYLPAFIQWICTYRNDLPYNNPDNNYGDVMWITVVPL